MKKSKPAAPAGLTATAQRLWREVVELFKIADPEGLALLRLACESLSDYEQFRAAIARDGATVTGRDGQLRAHPLISASRDARSAAMAALKQMDLDLGGAPARAPGRPTLADRVARGVL